MYYSSKNVCINRYKEIIVKTHREHNIKDTKMCWESCCKCKGNLRKLWRESLFPIASKCQNKYIESFQRAIDRTKCG